MSSARFWQLTLAAALVASSAAAGEGDNNWSRLSAMPREQRAHLTENLERFDALPASERADIRELDAAIARLDPAVRARYRVVLRRYHVWVKGLDDDRKKQLAQAGSAREKLDLVTQWKRAEVQADSRAKANLIFGLHPGDLGAIPPYEIASALRVWFELSPQEKKRIESIERLPFRISALMNMGQNPARKIPMQRFDPAIEQGLVDRLEADEKAKMVFPKQFFRAKKEEPAPNADPVQAAKKAERLNTFNPVHHLAESLYFSEHPPAAVTTENLALFETRIPNWLRASLDPLPPEDARRRLTILYRQIYPPGSEIPPPPKPDPAKAKASPSQKPGQTPSNF
jgi:hypothetical protein